MVNLETILSWFQTGDYPTQEEFEQTFSSFRHKDTKIPIAEVDGLESSLNSKLSVDDLPSNMALVDEGQPSDVFNKEQIMAMAMMLSDYVKDGKIRADKIEALGLTDLIESNERNIAEFAANSDKYEFQQNDFIAVPDDKGNFSLFIFKGEEKSDTKNYLPTGLTNITVSMVEGLQSALNTKLDKPAVNGNYFVIMNGTASYQAINPGSDHLLFWNGSEFKNSNIFRENSGLKYGIGTTTPAEQLHLTSRARMSGLVLENNTETLPQQLTYSSKKFFGTDDAGVKRPLMFADNDDFLSLANSLTDTQKTVWKTAMNGGWTTNTMSVAVITPPVVDNQDKNYWLTLKGANLNLNPANFSVEIMDSTGANVVATVPNSQVQLYTNGLDLKFYFNFKDLPIGQYRIRLNNGVASFTTGASVSINVLNSLVYQDLSALTWDKKLFNNATNSLSYGNGTTAIYVPDATVKALANDSSFVCALLSSQIIPANQNFQLELTLNVTANSGGKLAFYIAGLVDASTSVDLTNQTNFNGGLRSSHGAIAIEYYRDMDASIWLLSSVNQNSGTMKMLINRNNGILTAIYQGLTSTSLVQKNYTNNALKVGLYCQNTANSDLNVSLIINSLIYY